MIRSPMRRNKHTTANFAHVRELRKRVFVPQGNKDNAVVRESGEGVDDGSLLSSTWGTSGNEDTCEFAG
jgi:hypothetical protein